MTLATHRAELYKFTTQTKYSTVTEGETTTKVKQINELNCTSNELTRGDKPTTWGTQHSANAAKMSSV